MEALTYLVRAPGSGRSGDPAGACKNVEKLESLRGALVQAKSGYWATVVEVQRRTVAAWTASAKGKNEESLKGMRAATDLKGTIHKTPVTPAWIVAARELLGCGT